MSGAEYLAGAGFLLLTCASAGAAAAVAITRRAPRLEPAPLLLAWGGLAALAIFAAHLLPALVGLLSRESVAATAVAISAATWFWLRTRGERPAYPPPEPGASGRLSVLLAAIGAVAVAVYLIGSALGRADEALIHVDVTTFHLPNVARWIETGSFWQVDDFVPYRAPGNYPQTGDVFTLAAILPWQADFLARFVALPFLGLAWLGAYAAGRELGARRAPCALLGATLVAMPVVGYVGGLGLVDPEMLGCFAIGGFFLLRHWRTRERFDLVLAGIGLGLCFGTRWYAVFAVAAVFAVWALGSLLARRREGLARRAALLGSLIAACGGFWLLRNLVESGNPVFPVEVAPFGISLFDAPADLFRELQGFTLAGYLDQPGVWADYLWRPFLDFMGWGALALWLALAAALAISFRMRAQRTADPRVAALVAVAALIALAYLFTPYSATGPPEMPVYAWVNARYVVPALLIAAPLAARAISRSSPRLQPALEAVALLAVLDGIRRSAELPLGGIGTTAVVAALALVAAMAAAFAAGRRWPGRRLGPAVGLAVVIAALPLGALVEDRYAERRYAGFGPVFDRVNQAEDPPLRIGVVGDGFGIYPMFGPRLENRVEAVGRRVAGMLQPYQRRGPFEKAVAGADYDLVLVLELGTLDPSEPARQRGWLTGLGFQPVAAGRNPGNGTPLALYAPPG